MQLAKQISLWADVLLDISAYGLQFTKDTYDRERFQEVQDIAMAMLALSTNKTLAQMEPLKASIFSRPSPLVGGDAAVINDAGHILLIQRSDNAKWAMPGGLFKVGETPAEGVLRETYEETGVSCRVVALIGVFDSRLCGTTYPLHIYQFVFLCHPLNSKQTSVPKHKNESLDSNWFSEQLLPDDIDPGHVSRIPEAFRVWRGDTRAFYDE